MTRTDVLGRWRLLSYEAASKDNVIYEDYFAYYGDYTVDEAASTVTPLMTKS